MRHALTAACFIVLSFSAFAAEKPKDIPAGTQSIDVLVRPVKEFHLPQPASLEWVGGLDLTSTARGFGGFSGLALDESGQHATAISDGGVWLRFDLDTKNEIPLGVKNAELTPMLDLKGKSLAGQRRGDAESLSLQGGDALIGFEGINAIWRYPLARDGMHALPVPVSVPADLAQLRRTRGLESLAVFPASSRHKGALLAIAESPVRGEDNLRAWILDGDVSRRLTVLQHDGYDITDAAFLENGDLLLLERRYRPPFGIACRIRRIKGSDIAGSARLDGKIIFESDTSSPIDNMEGIAVHRGKDGATYVTLISDDNFNIFQRTLLLRFRLKEK